jgi:hypothetical protein
LDNDKRAEVLGFLAQFKKAASVGHIRLVYRPENEETIRDLEYTWRICEEILLALSTDDFARGPDEDRNRPGHVWVFGKRIGREIYIKLKVFEDGGRDYALCISFHYSEVPLQYPLRTEGDRQ